MMQDYDPLRSPNPEEWLALDESERQALVEAFHQLEGVELPNPRLHALIHTVVENQLAMPVHEVQRTLDRLLGEGLDRHEAVHAIGSVLAEHLHALMEASSVEGDPNDPYLEALERLTAETWRSAS